LDSNLKKGANRKRNSGQDTIENGGKDLIVSNDNSLTKNTNFNGLGNIANRMINIDGVDQKLNADGSISYKIDLRKQ
jgi:hypothetical protein